jgi:hypothetical protein
MHDPQAGAEYGAVAPDVAYRRAPAPLAEGAALIRLSNHLTVEAANGRTPDRQIERQLCLRRAALADRLNMDHPADEQFADEAVALSRELVEFDRAHPDLVAGPHGPDEFELSARPYVRQEFAAWLTTPAGAEVAARWNEGSSG